MMGTDNYTPDSSKHKGLGGAAISFSTQLLTDSTHQWLHQKGLTGEARLTPHGGGQWLPLPPTPPAWSWYSLTVRTPVTTDPTLVRFAPPPHVSAEPDGDGEGLHMGQLTRADFVLVDEIPFRRLSAHVQSNLHTRHR